MKEWKWIFAVLLLVPVGIIAGCIGDTGQDGDMKFTDPLGAEVSIEEYPERIVTLSPALTETVFALGIGEKVVGTDDVSNFPPEASGIENVFSYLGIDIEKLISVDPDLVLLDKTLDISEDAYISMKENNIPVYRIYPRTVDDVLDSLLGIGEIVNREAEARDIIDDFRERMNIIETYIEGIEIEDRPKILLVTYYDGSSDPWVSTDTTMTGGLIETAGGINIISDNTGIVVQVPVETIIEADPDIIICTQSTVWPTQTRTTILSDERWGDIGAVKDGKVFDVNGDIVDRTGPRLIEGLEAIHDHITDQIEE